MIWKNVAELSSIVWSQGAAIFWFFIFSVVISAGINVLRLDRKRPAYSKKAKEAEAES